MLTAALGEDRPITGAMLLNVGIDPSRTVTHARCPWCGSKLLWGYRKDRPQGTAMTIAHEAYADPVTGESTSGCETFQAVSHTSDFLRLLSSAGVRFAKLTL
jgi:predicted RNA-binding Zn-ribbon protein involved in translation (DUF1610 family)